MSLPSHGSSVHGSAIGSLTVLAPGDFVSFCRCFCYTLCYPRLLVPYRATAPGQSRRIEKDQKTKRAFKKPLPPPPQCPFSINMLCVASNPRKEDPPHAHTHNKVLDNFSKSQFQLRARIKPPIRQKSASWCLANLESSKSDPFSLAFIRLVPFKLHLFLTVCTKGLAG